MKIRLKEDSILRRVPTSYWKRAGAFVMVHQVITLFVMSPEIEYWRAFVGVSLILAGLAMAVFAITLFFWLLLSDD